MYAVSKDVDNQTIYFLNNSKEKCSSLCRYANCEINFDNLSILTHITMSSDMTY
jgi:hypothetical protein